MVDPEAPARTWTLAEANDELGRISERVRVAMGATELADVAAVAHELAEEGVLLRDVSSGLIDFAARSPAGRPYWLCWMWGEPEIDTWHWVEDGFAGRTPVSDPPA
jgi:hypothetical protein